MYLLTASLFAMSMALAGTPRPAAKEMRLFELRTYHAAAGKLDALNARFRDHTTKLFEKHGITNVGYWVPSDNKNNLLIYLLAFPDKEAHDKSWKEFAEDPDWKSAREASEVNGRLVDKVDSLFLNATDYSPKVKSVARKKERLFELRTYTTNPDKLNDLHARFHDHTIGIMKRYGAEIIGFWVPTDKEHGSENTLVYILAHKSREKSQEMAEKFPKDPEWLKAKEESEKSGKLVDKVESVFMAPVDYSAMK